MVVLSGKNLGERQRELNYKVAEAVSNKKKIDDIRMEEEASDVDQLYKIDIASQYKDIDYIVEVLKSGDSVYVSRALRCVWLYHDDYSHIVNTENLHDNIFPFMSKKMKKKMLSTIFMHDRNSDRAANYFNYCKDNHMPKLAFKFLNFTSEEFKLHVINVIGNTPLFNLCAYIKKPTHLENFIGNSFVLATAFIEEDYHLGTNFIYNLRFLYTINNEKYLDILEKYINVHQHINYLLKYNTLQRLGIRISRDIVLKHKNRVLKNPLLYVNILNKSMLIKYTSKCEAEKYITGLFPPTVTEFWRMDFRTAYCFILNLIPKNEQFEYIKQLFVTNYPGAAFETTMVFYKLKYYEMMSIDHRELWALKNIDEGYEILGEGNDYIWYKFVNIDKALIDIKKYVMVTPDNEKRSCIVNILVKAARDQKDLKKVLDYYYDRHVNESEEYKNKFIDKVLHNHNVFEFNIECWEALNKLFHSLDVYSVGKYCNKVYLAVAVFYHILHNIDLPPALIEFIDLDVNYSYFTLLLNKLSKEKSEIVLQYILKLFLDKLKPFEQNPYDKKLRKKLIVYVNNISNLLTCFQKEDEEWPEIIRTFMDIHSPKPTKSKMVNAKDIFRYIKTDATLAIDVLNRDELDVLDCRDIVNLVVRKIKIYFSNDIAQAYLRFLDRIINKSSDDCDSDKLIQCAIFGIFQLADQNFKVALMEKYYPSKPKIEHGVIDRKLMYIQKAICKFVAYSRPPMPFNYVLQYIKGDYVPYCLPMFNIYLANLPLPLVMNFTESILDAPISVQKHGLRLAFDIYTTENLMTLLLNTWKKSKNVSLRQIIYKLIFDKLFKQKHSGNDEDVRILYEGLKFCTSDLHQDDDEDVFQQIRSYHRLPDIFIDDYLQTAWAMMIKLPNKPVNIERQLNIIENIDKKINLVNRDFIRKTIIEKHVHKMLEIRRLRPIELENVQNFWVAKWNLTANYIVRYSDDEELQQSLTLLNEIIKKCLKMWSDKYKGTYVCQNFFYDFIAYIEKKSQSQPKCKESWNVPIFKQILDTLQETVPLKEVYLLIWDLKFTIFLQTSVCTSITVLDDRDGKSKSLSQHEILSENIAHHIQNFVQELLVQHKFYSIYLSKIAWLLEHKLQYLTNPIGFKNVDIFLSQSLANIGLKETQLLALTILPTSVPKEMREIHISILKKIQAFEDEEVESFLHFKFLSSYRKKSLYIEEDWTDNQPIEVSYVTDTLSTPFHIMRAESL